MTSTLLKKKKKKEKNDCNQEEIQASELILFTTDTDPYRRSMHVSYSYQITCSECCETIKKLEKIADYERLLLAT